MYPHLLPFSKIGMTNKHCLFRVGLKFVFSRVLSRTNPLQPNVCKCYTSDVSPIRFLWQVSPMSITRTPLFLTYTAVETALAQDILGRPYSIKKHQAISFNVLFILSATPFCWGCLAQERRLRIPQLSRNSLKVSLILFKNITSTHLEAPSYYKRNIIPWLN